MKIAFIGQKGIPANGGGVERYVEDLAVRIATRSAEAVVYTRPYYTPSELREYRGVRLISLPSLRSKHLDAISHSFLSVMHASFNGFDVIHFQSIGSSLVSWIPKIFSPSTHIVSTLQSRDYEHQKWGSVARWFLRLGEKMMCRFSDEVIVVTELMRDYVRAEYGLEAKYVPNGANLYEAPGSEALAKWDLTTGEYIVAISRLVRHKGLHYLIESYRQLPVGKMPLVIVGEGAYTDDYVRELHQLAQGDPDIIFTGAQSGQDLAELYANAYIFVQPSESEGLSLALLEAMSRRVPVLVSDIGENLEAIGDSGFVFASKDIADLREKLRFILSEPELAADKAAAARERIETKFNWDRIADDIFAIYQRQSALPAAEPSV